MITKEQEAEIVQEMQKYRYGKKAMAEVLEQHRRKSRI